MNRRAFAAGAAALAAMPWAARAQQQSGKAHRMAYVSLSRPTSDMTEDSRIPSQAAFFTEMRRLGYAEGRNLIVERHSGQGRTDPYREFAREVVESHPDVIVANATPFVAALKALTTTIPIVGAVNDPVASGLVASLARPGGNVTAFTTDAGAEINGKALELLRDAKPTAARLVPTFLLR